MIIVDGQQSALSLGDHANLEEVLSALMEDVAFEDRIVTDVLVDGEPFSELYPHQAEDVDTGSFQSLEVRTVSVAEMAADVVVELPKVIDIMAVGSRKAAELLRQSEVAEGLEMLQDIIAVSRDLLGTINVLRLKYSSGPISALDELGDSLGDLLGEIGDAMEDEDWLLVADLIEYEFEPACEGWRAVIGVITDAVNKLQAA